MSGGLAGGGPAGARRTGGTPRPLVVVPWGGGSVPFLEVASAARPAADVVWLVSSDDPEVGGSLRLLRRLGTVVDAAGLGPDQVAAEIAPFRPAGVLPLVDRDLVPLADLAVRLGLPFHSPAVAHGLTDKLAQRRALARAGVPVPGCWPVPDRRDPASLAGLATEVRFPAVVKPRCGAASRHTVLVHDHRELAVALDLAAAGGGAEPMLVEEYLQDREDSTDSAFAGYVSVESIVDASGIHHAAVTGRLVPAPPFRERGMFLPSALGSADAEAVLAAATEALEALGVRLGCCHTEIKLTPAGPRIVEVNGRMGGGVPGVLRAAAGIDLIGLCIGVAVGEPAGIDGPVACDRTAYWFTHQPPPTAWRIRSIGDLKEVARIPGVVEVVRRLGPGDSVEPWRGTLTFDFSVLGVAPDHGGVAEAARRVDEMAEVTYDHATTPPAAVAPEEDAA